MTRGSSVIAALAAAIIAGASTRAVTPQPGPSPSISFSDFLNDIRAEARARGIRQTTIDLTLGDLTPEPVVVARDRTQPELTQSLDAYIARRLTTRTVSTGRQQLATHRELVARVEDAYGVPPSLMIAIWGLESNFGRFTGTYSTIRSLATLAYDGRRPIFRTELFNALTIVDRGDAAPADLKGSWAGAMGQPQFMPSSFLKYAVDEDKDGRRDIWTSREDVFASMANFLKQRGWTAGQRWGREVTISRAVMTRIDRRVPMRTTGCRAIRELTEPRPVTEWQTLGVRLAGNRPLPSALIPASLVRGQKRHFLVYGNFEALLEYNCSNAYAVTVGLLADRIGAAK